MTAYLLTEAQHAQIVDALTRSYKFNNAPLIEALAMLKAMKPVEPCAYRQWVEGGPKLKDAWMLASPEAKHKCSPQLMCKPLYALGDTA